MAIAAVTACLGTVLAGAAPAMAMTGGGWAELTTITGTPTPYDVAVAPDQARVYVTNATGNNISVIDTASNTVSGTIDVGGHSAGIAVTPDGATAWVAVQNNPLGGPGTAVAVDTATGDATPVALPGNPISVVVSPDAGQVYVAMTGGGVAVIDTSTMTLTGTIALPGGEGIQDLAITPNGAYIYGTNPDGTQVFVLSTSAREVSATIPITTAYASLGPFGIAVTPDGSRAYAASVDNVAVIDTASNTVSSYITVPPDVRYGVAVSPDGSEVVVTDNGAAGPSGVTRISTATNAVSGSLPSGAGPTALAYFADGTRIYMTNLNSNSVTVLHRAAPAITAPVAGATADTGTPTISGTTATGSEAGDIVTVTDQEGNTICTATVDAGSTWACTPEAPVANGMYTLTAVQTDSDGNRSLVSDAVTFTIAVSVPAPSSTPSPTPSPAAASTGGSTPPATREGGPTQPPTAHAAHPTSAATSGEGLTVGTGGMALSSDVQPRAAWQTWLWAGFSFLAAAGTAFVTMRALRTKRSG